MIEDDPVDTTHFRGGNNILSCNASGVPLPTITWYQDDIEITDSSRVLSTTLVDEVNEGLVQSTLVFTDIELSDDSDYYCEASNTGAFTTVFTVRSATVHFTVQRKSPLVQCTRITTGSKAIRLLKGCYKVVTT